jgi:hypothetical protein
LCAVIEFLFAEDHDSLQRLDGLCGTVAKLDEEVVGGIGQQFAACRQEVEVAVVTNWPSRTLAELVPGALRLALW